MNVDNYAGIPSLIGFAKVAAQFTSKNYLLDSCLISVLWVLFFMERENVSSYICTSVMHQCLLLWSVWTTINMQNIVCAGARLLFNCVRVLILKTEGYKMQTGRGSFRSSNRPLCL